MTNDPDNYEISLRIGGMVERFAEIQPQTVWLKGPPNEKIVQKVTIRSTEKYPFSLIGFSLDKGAHIRVDFKNSSSGNSWELTLTNAAGHPGKYSDVIRLKTNHAEIPEIFLRVNGAIGENKTMYPPLETDDGPPILKK